MKEILHQPSERARQESQMAQYMRWLADEGYPKFDSYRDLHRWSVTEIERFWESIWHWGDVIHEGKYSNVLEKRIMPGAKWFPGVKLNFAQNLLRFALKGERDKIAITSTSETRDRVRLTYSELLDQVTRLASYLKELGVKKGDRVAGIVANTPEPIVAMLATTSIGAIWSSCSPDFGVQGIFDRFSQVQPKVLITVNGYRYGGKDFDCMGRVDEILKRVPSIEHVLVIPYSDASGNEAKLKNALSWKDAVRKNADEPLSFEQVAFDHPVYILYTSGTTGLPKCIVHGGGGVLLQHIKELRLHTDVTERDRFFYFTTCGWMMWNWLVSGLMTGAELKLFDGAPMYPSPNRLWEYAEEEGISIFGTSAKFVGACRSKNVRPKEKLSLGSIQAILSTGSPLLPEDFDWLYDQFGEKVRVSSIAGGTDIVSCFVLGNPLLPVRRGKIQCKGLGMDVKAFDEKGKEVINQQGELVCTKPAPSMPVSFWNDPKNERYLKAYFDRYPGVWWHGDYVLFDEDGGTIMFGRSDATLNPGGVRIGTAEIYRQVETLEEIQDSLVVAQDWEGDQRIILFVMMQKGHELTDVLVKKIKDRIRKEATPRHVPAKIIRVTDIPYTISGKKVELAVAKIIKGQKIENRDALANPKSLDQFQNLEELKS